MTGLVFVDTNVLLYSLDQGEGAKHQCARDWMETLWTAGNGRTSMQVLSEFFFNATRKLAPGLPREQAWDFVVALSDWRPQTTDFRILEIGEQVQAQYGLSWWDSLIVAAAHQQRCGTLLTEDLQHAAVYAGVTAMNPFRVGVQESHSEYSPRLAVQPLRGRGRPRKAAS